MCFASWDSRRSARTTARQRKCPTGLLRTRSMQWATAAAIWAHQRPFCAATPWGERHFRRVIFEEVDRKNTPRLSPPTPPSLFTTPKLHLAARLRSLLALTVSVGRLRDATQNHVRGPARSRRRRSGGHSSAPMCVRHLDRPARTQFGVCEGVFGLPAAPECGAPT